MHAQTMMIPSMFVGVLRRVLWIASIVACLSVSLVQWQTTYPTASASEPTSHNYSWNKTTHKNTSTAESDASWSFQRFGIDSAFSEDLYYSSESNRENDYGTTLRSSRPSSCLASRFHLTQQANVVPRHDVQHTHHQYVVNMTVSFTLAYPQCESARVTVWYGESNNATSIHSIVVEESPIQFHYNASLARRDMLDEDYQSDFIYHVTLPELEAGRVRYWYSVETHIPLLPQQREDEKNDLVATPTGLNATTATTTTNTKNVVTSIRRLRTTPAISTSTASNSRRYVFSTPPLSNAAASSFANSAPTVLALVGDLGQTENSTKTMKHIYDGVLNGTISSLVIAGDLSYADGDPFRWTRWMELMEPLLRMVPLFSVPGNHEIECDASTSEVFQQYEAYFRNPNRYDPDILPIPTDYQDSLWSCLTASQFLGHYNYGNAFWSVQHGLVHVIGLNSYTSVLPDSPQYLWLQTELQWNVNRTETPWLIVVFHCPLHTSFVGHDGEINPLLMLQTIEPLLVRHQVNLVVSGHDHAYLRTHPMVGGTVNEKGPVYWTLGAGGNREQHNKGYIHEIPEEWVAQRDLSDYGYGQFSAVNATHAHLTWVKDGTTTMGVNDEVWMENNWYHNHGQDYGN